MGKQRIRLEICIESIEDGLIAAENGADQLEINSCLNEGGLSPTSTLVSALRSAITLPLFVMVRPRRGGFCYSDREFHQMLREAEAAIEAGANGIVTGCLNEDGALDWDRMGALRDRIKPHPLILHRAFDLVSDPLATLKQSIEIGVSRILTSGQKQTAIEGAPLIKLLQEKAAGQLEIWPGGGIRPENVIRLCEITGCRQVHASLRQILRDPSMKPESSMRFSNFENIPQDAYSQTSAAWVQQMREVLDSLQD